MVDQENPHESSHLLPCHNDDAVGWRRHLSGHSTNPRTGAGARVARRCDCPRLGAAAVYERCDVHCPTLAEFFRP
jgi:hypothetical protein